MSDNKSPLTWEEARKLQEKLPKLTSYVRDMYSRNGYTREHTCGQCTHQTEARSGNPICAISNRNGLGMYTTWNPGWMACGIFRSKPQKKGKQP